MTRARAPYHPLAGLLSLLAALALLVGLAAPAWADDQDEIDDAIENLSGASTLYVGDGSVAIDRGTVSGSLNPNRKIAVLDVSDADSAAVQIAQVLDIELVAVASREYIGVGYRNGVFCGDYPVQASEDAVSEHQDDWDDGDLTSVLSAFASKMAAAPKPGSSACSDYLANGGTGSTAGERDGGGGGGWIVLLVLLGIVVALVIAFVLYSRKSKAKSVTVAKDKVMPYYTRLAQEILGFDTKDSDDALQAIADASAKYSAASEQIEAAQTVEDWAAARVTVLEGLNASRLARLAVGGEEGEPIPAIAEPAPDQLSAPQQVQVQGETFQGFPQYTPGSSYYYGGGSGVPGGWYSTPFWERLLIGGMFGGMSGGGFTGAGTGRSSTPDRSAPSRRRGSSSGRGGWSSGGRGGSSSRGRSGGGRRSGGGGWSSGGRG